MSDEHDPKSMTRRTFNLASVSAGLGALIVGPELAWAQDPKGAMQQRQRVTGPAPDAPSAYAHPERIAVDLHVEYESTPEHLSATLYLVNRSSGALRVVHKRSNVAVGQPIFTLEVAQKEYTMRGEIPSEEFMISRRIYHEFLTLPAPRENSRAVDRIHFGRFVAPWPDAILAAKKSFAGRRASVRATFGLSTTPLDHPIFDIPVGEGEEPVAPPSPIEARARASSIALPWREGSSKEKKKGAVKR